MNAYRNACRNLGASGKCFSKKIVEGSGSHFSFGVDEYSRNTAVWSVSYSDMSYDEDDIHCTILMPLVDDCIYFFWKLRRQLMLRASSEAPRCSPAPCFRGWFPATAVG